MGVSAKDMLHVADGEDNPEKLSNLARRTMKLKKQEQLALQGNVNPHQRLMLKTILTHIDFLTNQIDCWTRHCPMGKRISGRH